MFQKPIQEIMKSLKILQILLSKTKLQILKLQNTSTKIFKKEIVSSQTQAQIKQKKKTDSEIDKLLNSLEDIHNHIRAVFTVQRLTEGWDVLNLFDIVRLYEGRDMNYKTNKVGTSTTSEVQLIGRGVRYFPFSVEGKNKNRRKFDNDLTNELRVLEEFYFHSDNDSKYISDLSLALKRSNLLEDTREEKKFAVKKRWIPEFKKMYLLCNKRIENEKRKLKTLPDDFVKLYFSYNFENKTSQIIKVNLDGDDENTNSFENVKPNTQNINILDVPRNIIYKALHTLNTDENSYYNFERLRKRFNISGMQEFLDFINPIPIELIFKDGMSIKNEEPYELLEMVKQFFLYSQKELEKFDNPYKATDFELVPFEQCFPFETTRMIDTKSSDYSTNRHFEIKCKNFNWYALDSFWGTSEERELVDFVYNHYSNLFEKYQNICLLRNEEVYKIFDFETGQGFQPDFLLLLKSKSGEDAYFQVFIEPKAKHLKCDDNDGWKEKFILEISKRYGIEKPFRKEAEKFVLYGLPFFNRTDTEMYNKFNSSFEDFIKIDVKLSDYEYEETELNVAENVN